MRRDKVLNLINIEADRGLSIYGEFNSYHEAYAVIKEEFDELWDKIKNKECDPDKIEKEAIHTGAMIVRFLTELC